MDAAERRRRQRRRARRKQRARRIGILIAATAIIAVALTLTALKANEADATAKVNAQAPEQQEQEENQQVETRKQQTEPAIDEADIEMLARLIWGEARGVGSTTEQAAVVWCVLNRVDSSEFPDTIAEVVTQENQFYGYYEDAPVLEEFTTLAEDVLRRYYSEAGGEANSGRVLPKEYTYFTGDGVRNYFRNAYTGGDIWGWSLETPYSS